MDECALLDIPWPHEGRLPAIASPLWRSLDGRWARAYRPLAAGGHAAADWTACDALTHLRGRAWGQPATHHYAVEADVSAEHEDDFDAWYAREHLPGLAAVPGTVCAYRLTRRHPGPGRPRYMACYDLVSAAVLEHPAWLAVRGTPWSDVVRPTFVNPRRTLFVRSDLFEAAAQAPR